jgi:uncharacterized membrane protein YozB (DUF420 family)
MRRKKIEAHRKVMTTAFAVSTVFLISYLIYHYHVGSVPFKKTGILRTLYFSILLTHTILAASVAVLAPLTLFRGWTKQFARHRRIAKITFPIWLYVSVTGVVVYLMLYQM